MLERANKAQILASKGKDDEDGDQIGFEGSESLLDNASDNKVLSQKANNIMVTEDDMTS